MNIESINWRKPVAALVVILVFMGVSAQTRYEGDRLLDILGKPADSPEFANLKSGYQLDMANETHYLSQQGIELILAGGTVTQIQLYSSSAVYGQFAGTLPVRLTFGMTPTQVRAILGKPTVAYNLSGYLEFEAGRFVYACSFEKGRMNQLSVSLK